MTPSEILEYHQLKKTNSRISIIQALQTESSPLSESDLKYILGNLYDRTTFYRNMQTLTDAGIIHRVVADNVVVKYVLNNCEKEHQHITDHIHFYCQQCKKLICMKDLKMQTYTLPDGFKQESGDMIIRGLCNNCNK